MKQHSIILTTTKKAKKKTERNIIKYMKKLFYSTISAKYTGQFYYLIDLFQVNNRWFNNRTTYKERNKKFFI